MLRCCFPKVEDGSRRSTPFVLLSLRGLDERGSPDALCSGRPSSNTLNFLGILSQTPGPPLPRPTAAAHKSGLPFPQHAASRTAF